MHHHTTITEALCPETLINGSALNKGSASVLGGAGPIAPNSAETLQNLQFGPLASPKGPSVYTLALKQSLGAKLYIFCVHEP